MYCENCGARIEDDQPFCPNCGKRVGPSVASSAASSNPGKAAPRPARAVSNTDGLLDKYHNMPGQEKIFYPLVVGLLVVCFILSLTKIFDAGFFSFTMGTGYPFFSSLFNTLLTLSITFLVLDYFDKFTFRFLWIFITAVSVLLLILFVILWIDSGVKLSVGGWLSLLSHAGLTGCSVILFLQKKQN